MTDWKPNPRGNYFERRAYRESRKDAIAAEKARKDADAMTCQCCARRIFAQTGTVAHHGYERPGTGWQTASCMGAKHLPFEVSRDRLGDLITRIEHDIQETTQMIAGLRAERIDVPFFWTEYVQGRSRFGRTSVQKSKRFNRADFDALVKSIIDTLVPLRDAHTVYGEAFTSVRDALGPMERAIWNNRSDASFDRLLKNEIDSAVARLGQLRSFRTECQLRFDSWKQTHSHFDASIKEWVAL